MAVAHGDLRGAAADAPRGGLSRLWAKLPTVRGPVKEQAFVSCSRCADKEQALSTAGSLLVGWWAIPHGLILTPFALLTNAYHMIHSVTRKEQPSPLLLAYARECLATTSRNGASWSVPSF